MFSSSSDSEVSESGEALDLPLLLRGGTNGGIAVLGGEGDREYWRRCFGTTGAGAALAGGTSESESEQEESEEESEEEDDEDEDEEELEDDATKERSVPVHLPICRLMMLLTARTLRPLRHRLLHNLLLSRITVTTTVIIG